MFLITAITALIYSIASFKTSKMLIEDADFIFSGIIPENEIDQIKELWRISYIIAIFELIETIISILIGIFELIAIILFYKNVNANLK